MTTSRDAPSARSRPSLAARTLSPKSAGYALTLRNVGPNWRRLRGELTEDELGNCERAIGLAKPDPEFRNHVADAIFAGLCLHHRLRKPNSVIRAQFKLAEKRAAAAATALDALRNALGAISLKLIGADAPPLADTLLSPATADWLRGLAGATHADAVIVPPGKRGARRLVWFDVMLYLLADAYGHATGKPATVTADDSKGRYSGPYMALIEKVLPIAAQLIGDPSVAQRSNAALGKRAQRALARRERAASDPQK